MRVVVTGGRGFIGQWVLKELRSRELTGISFDGHDGQDVTDSEHVFQTIGRDADAVIHLAGVLGTEDLFGDARAAIDVNIGGTLNVLRACEVYGTRYVGITMPEVWDNVYQATKRCARDLAVSWNRHYGVPVSHVRAFNAFGEGQKLRPVQKIVPTFAAQAWAGKPIPIWGDGTQTVDLVYAGDVARMLVDALGFGNAEVLDAGTGVPYTVLEVAEMVLSRTAGSGGIEFLPMRKGEHETKIVASGEGWNLQGWKPEFRLQDLNQTIDSYAG